MKEYLAYVDESGDPNFSAGATKTLFFGAVVFPSERMEELDKRLSEIKGKHRIVELKSQKVRTYQHRVNVCSDLVGLGFKFVTLLFKKNELQGNWFRHRQKFYKYAQRLLNTEVYRLFANVYTRIDKYGSPAYQQSVREYLDRSLQRELFDSRIEISSAKSVGFIQVADYLSGTLRKIVEGDFEDSSDIERIMESQWVSRMTIPDTGKVVSPVPDVEFTHCMDEAKRFLDKSSTDENDPQVLTLDYLYHSALVYPDRWVYTQEIQQWLKEFGVVLGEEQFRNEITASLRDQGVVIVGTRKGLKIPTSSEDIREYSEFCVKLALPVLRRLKRALQFMDAREESLSFSDMLSPEVRAVLGRVDA